MASASPQPPPPQAQQPTSSSSSSSTATPDPSLQTRGGPTPSKAAQQQQAAQQQFSAAAASQTRPARPSTFTPQGGPVGYQQPSAAHAGGPTLLNENTPPPQRPTAASAAAGLHSMYPDPHAIYLNLSCLDFLLMELIPLSERVVEVIGEGKTAGAINSLSSPGKAVVPEKDGRIGEEERKGAVFKHVEGLGYRVGQGLAERFSQDRPRFTDVLDVMKFVCKDLWQLVFRKQIDNLKTNHRGVYVLTDSSFRLLMRMSTDVGGLDTITRAQPYLWFPCGVIRGALANLGVQATVVAEITGMPVAVFHVQTMRQDN